MSKSLHVTSTGDFNNIETYLLKHRKSMFSEKDIENIAEKSIELFRENTPSKTGKTSESWFYSIEKESNDRYVIVIHNDNIQNGLNIALLVDSGHATATGNYVAGKHYIDETIQQIYTYVNNYK